MSKIAIVSVLKSGGDYNEQYVKKLEKSVCRQLQSDSYSFICLTDTQIGGINTFLLENDYKSWWSKIELFKFEGPCVYFDLDTVIVGNLAPLLNLVQSVTETKIWMLKPFGKHEIMASGVMAWTGDWQRLYEEFDYERDSKAFRGDQDYLTSKLTENVDFIQNHVSGVYSYKYHCRQKLPQDARIVCFHGRPRPHQVHNDWVNKYWRV